jgi:hypothetical protein
MMHIPIPTAAEYACAASDSATVAFCKAPTRIRAETIAGSAYIRSETEHNLCAKFQH